MTFQDFELGDDKLVTLSFEANSLTEADEGRLVTLDPIPGTAEIRISFRNGRSATCHLSDARSQSMLKNLQEAGSAQIVSVLAVNNQKVVLLARKFASALSFPSQSPLEVLVTERVVDDLPQSAKGSPCDYLTGQFFIDECAFILSSAKATSSDFTFIGPKYRMDVAIRNGIPHTNRIRKRPKGWVPSGPVRILRGAIRFKDATISAALRSETSQELKRKIGAGEYLSTWDVYNELEAHHLRLRLNEFGFLRYTAWSRSRWNNKTVLEFQFTEALPDRLRREAIDVEASSERPAIDSETGNIYLPEDLVAVGALQPPQSSGIKAFVVPTRESEWVRPPLEGYLLPSVRGNKVQLDRREKALKRVLEGDAPLVTLEGLIEKGDAPISDILPREPLSRRSLAALHNSPTSAQKEALDCALNTPDIAVIQGPPGTGKTSVIRSLITRWIELQETRASGEGNQRLVPGVLVASAQHDAVDNAIEGFDIDGLPAFRMGGRRTDNKEERLRSTAEWVRDRQKVCAERLAELGNTPGRQLARDADRLIAQYRRVHGVHSQNVLRELLHLVRVHLPPALLHDLTRAVTEIDMPKEVSEEPVGQTESQARLKDRLEHLISSQRLSYETFTTDGLFQAQRLLEFLEMHSAELNITAPMALRELLGNTANVEESIRLLKLSIREIEMGAKRGTDAAISTDSEAAGILDHLLENISASVRDLAAKGKDGIAEAISAYIEELQDLQAVTGMIEKYSGVMAATCQQSVMQDYRDIVYELVIIDEAARVSPMDLLIPMSHGQKIVLVGDHKQLPHMLEPEVKESFVKSARGNREFIEESLFQRLFDSFLAVQRSGGPKRVVTLLDDYRMHPIIGDFVSSEFYPGIGLKPRRTEEERAHNLGMYNNRPVAWIDVPHSRGSESGPPAYSKSRAAEIRVVADEVLTILQKKPEFTVGIITFYEQQATRLKNELDSLPVEFRARLQVGTVDAFQGREFDVVLISTVRSNRHRMDLRKRIGFLDCSNRLCVAFSRAKRLMVLAGDSETVAGTAVAPAISSMLNFLNLCREKGWYEQR